MEFGAHTLLFCSTGEYCETVEYELQTPTTNIHFPIKTSQNKCPFNLRLKKTLLYCSVTVFPANLTDFGPVLSLTRIGTFFRKK